MLNEKTSGFSVPLGLFQIHLPANIILPAARRMGDAIRRLQEAVASPNTDEFGRITKEVAAARDAMNAALGSMEAPEVLPAITRQLLYASLIAEALGLRFEIINYRRESHDGQTAYWWVDGQATNPAGEAFRRPGTSFSFDLDDDKRAEGALLSACADAFIHSVFAVVPFFPWDRWS